MLKMNRTYVACALISGLASFSATAFAANSSLSSKDQQFITKAAQAGHAEVAAGKIASAKSTSDEVKKFGDQMVQDHGKANDELSAIAKTKGITPPAEPDAAHKKMAGKLEAAKPADFDKLYLKEAGVKDHKAAVALFTDEAKNGKDADVKSFAQKTLPTVQHHYEMAQNLAKKK